jgi:tRNA-dihydrouridine synthase B
MIASNALATGNHELMVRKLERRANCRTWCSSPAARPSWMAEGAQIAHDAGADIIDINFGCPSKRVTNGLAGSALMRVPDQALRSIDAVRRRR